MSFHFTQTQRYSPTALYQTAIQLMYDLAQRDWGEGIHIVDSKSVRGNNVFILFVNPRDPKDPGPHLQICHCVAALYRGVTVITNGMMFFELKSELAVEGRLIGAMSVKPLPVAAEEMGIDGKSGNSSGADVASMNETGDAEWGFETGQIKDPLNPHFILNYTFLGKRITAKEVSLVVLEALTSAAPHSRSAKCKEIMVASSGGGAVIVIEGTETSRVVFTYSHATEALKLLYQNIVIPEKKFGDVYLVIIYDEGGARGEQVIGELRMLRAGDGRIRNGAERGVSSE